MDVSKEFLKLIGNISDVDLKEKLIDAYKEWKKEQSNGMQKSKKEKIVDRETVIENQLINNPKMTAQEIAKRLGCSDKTIRRSEAWKKYRQN